MSSCIREQIDRIELALTVLGVIADEHGDTGAQETIAYLKAQVEALEETMIEKAA
jgi:hypothetical protein